MGLTSGFYNSNNGDRRYSADQMTAIFDGIFTDGVFENYPPPTESNEPNSLAVTPYRGNAIRVARGRAWFNHKWIDLSDDFTIQLDPIPNGTTRKDVIVLIVNTSNTPVLVTGQRDSCPGRSALITVVSGDPSVSDPQSPIQTWPYTPSAVSGVYFYPLATVVVARGGSEVLDSDITRHVGTPLCPYCVTRIKPISEGVNITVDGQTFVVVSAPPYTLNFSGATRGISANGKTGHGSHIYSSAPTAYNSFAEAMAAYDQGLPLRACWQGTPGSSTSPRVYISNYNVYTCTQPSSGRQGRAIGFWYSWVHATNWDAGNRDLDVFGALHINWYEDGTLIILYERFGDPHSKASGSSDDYDYQAANSGSVSYDSVPYEGT